MGQKTNPIGMRLSLRKNWQSRWLSKGNFAKFLLEDHKIRLIIHQILGANSGISEITIRRSGSSVSIDINSSKPGVVIGRQGKGIDAIQKKLRAKFGNELNINILEVRKPELSARLVAENISSQITRRLPYRRASKQALEKTTEAGALGIKIQVSGRLNGAEIARTEKFHRGTLPSGTMSANIDYALVHTPTIFGIIGVKVWIYTGKISEE